MIFITLERKYEVKTKNHGTVELPENTFEIPQVENLAEAVQFAGGEDALVSQYNDAIKGTAKNGATAVIRNASEGSVIADVIAKAVDYARKFTFSADRKVSKARTLEGVETLRGLAEKGQLDSMSQSDLLALLNQTLALGK